MITVEHLTKYYGGHLAVNDISFEISEGHVYGFLGPNGAGKSTTMNIITGCLSATSGRVLIDGHDIFDEPYEAKRLVGYLPEHPPLYMNETPWEYLCFVAEAKGLKGEQRLEQVNEVLEKTGITHVRNRLISSLSKGYRQRVGIAQALLNNPKVIILDEPTVGLDPIQLIEIRELIRELGKTHTVIFSSHILSEVQTICDQILMIAKGRLAAFGSPEELQKQLTDAGEVAFVTDAEERDIRECLQCIKGAVGFTLSEEEKGTRRVVLRSGKENAFEAAGEIFKAFAAKGHTLYELTPRKTDLENVFLELSTAAAEKEDEV